MIDKRSRMRETVVGLSLSAKIYGKMTQDLNCRKIPGSSYSMIVTHQLASRLNRSTKLGTTPLKFHSKTRCHLTELSTSTKVWQRKI